MSCLISNLHIDPQGRHHIHFDPHRHDLHDHSGFFGHLGIGDPAAYFYIDTWTLKGSRAFLVEKARIGFRRVEEEMRAYPNTLFVPVYTGTTECQPQEHERVRGLTMITQTLWHNNFFRQLYIGAAAMTTCHYWLSASFCQPPNMHIIHYNERVNPYIVGEPLAADSRKSFILEHAILGISKRALLSEQAVMMVDNYDLPLMTQGYRQYSHLITAGITCRAITPLQLFVYRRGQQRRVINWSAVVDTLKVDPVILEDRPFAEQVCLIRHADTILAAHGAALTHILFMRRTSLAIELFPCDFKKSIYRNLALVMGVRYRWWQAANLDDCPQLPSKPLDWTDLDSKNGHRNQNFRVDLTELRKVFHFDATTGNYLTYMPFEQFNNQLISLRCACGIARLLNRTLVVPELGYNQRRHEQTGRVVYEPTAYTWRPIGRYFNTTVLYHRLPCATIPYSAYYGEVRTINRIYYRRLGARYNNRLQPESYYHHLAHLHYLHHRSLPNHLPVYMNSTEVIRAFGEYGRTLRHFAVGNVFWMYRFDAGLAYPQVRYVDLYSEGCGEYRQIADALVFNSRFTDHFTNRFNSRFTDRFNSRFTDRFNSRFTNRHHRAIDTNNTPPSGAIHWRRGDYREKCGEELFPMRCFPTHQHLLAKLQDLDPRGVVTWTVLSNRPSHRLRLFLHRHGYTTNVLTYNDGDPIDKAIMDQIVAVEATYFIGNMYSSFTRTIVDKRVSLQRPVLFL